MACLAYPLAFLSLSAPPIDDKARPGLDKPPVSYVGAAIAWHDSMAAMPPSSSAAVAAVATTATATAAAATQGKIL